MAKIDPLDDVGSLANTTSARAVINSNSQKIEDAFANTLSRDGSGPNQMEADIDLNDHYLLNVADPVNEADGVNLRSVRPLVERFAAQIVETAVFGTQIVDPFTATPGQTDFALSEPPGSIENVSLFIDELAKLPGVDFTLTGSTLQKLVVTPPLSGGETVLIRYAKALPSGIELAQNVTYTPPITAVDTTVKGFLDDLQATGTSKGAALVRMIQDDANAVARTVQDKLRESKSIKDFGAIGDGITDDTLAVTKAMAFMANTGHGVHLPPGIYLCDPFVINTQFYDLQAMFTGDDRERCILRRRGTGAGPFIQLGDPLSTVYQSGVNFSGIQIDGGATTNGPAIAMYDVVRTSFHQCRFRGGSDAVKMYGGISVSFYDCVADLALRGMDITKFTSLAGGGYPNLIKWIGGEIVDNAQWGVRFDYGNMLILRDCDVEGNGTTPGASEGGVYVGPNVGEAVFASDTNSPGLIMSGCWVEANKGRAGVMLESGRNSLESCWWFSQAANITNDVYVTGGRYTATNCKFSFAKAANLLEGPSVLAGNLIQNTIGAVLSIDAVKTMLINGSTFPFIQYNGGRTLVASGISAPHIQVGSDSTGVNPTITFNPAFKTGTVPKISLTPISNSAGTIDAPEAYNVTATGFTIRKKSYNGTTIGTLNYQVDWQAVGEALGT